MLEDKEQIFNHMKSVIEKSGWGSVLSSIGGMQLVYNNFFEELQENDKFEIAKEKERKKKKQERGRKKREKAYVGIRLYNKDRRYKSVKVFSKNPSIQIRHLQKPKRLSNFMS